MQAGQQAEQKQIRDIITKNNKPAPPPSDVRYTGTGFAINNDGYFVTAYHVINNDGNGYGDSVYIQNKDGQYFKATLVNFDAKSDVAIMKVEKKNFHFGKGEVPYTFAEDKAGLGISIYTLGYPTDDLVYDEGYISSKNGFQGNAGQYTLQLAVGHGQSGSPVIDEEGNMLGILTAIGRQGESNTYAVSSKAIISLIHSACNDKTIHLPKINRLGNMSREEQIEKMEAYTFSVKVYKK
jgi:serine protease Do